MIDDGNDVDSNDNIVDGYSADNAIYFELGYRTDSDGNFLDKITVESVGGIDNLPMFDPSTNKIEDYVKDENGTITKTGWDSELDMIQFKSTNGLKQVWFEMEHDECGILMKDSNTNTKQVRVIRNTLQKLMNETYTRNINLYNESIYLNVDTPVNTHVN